MLDVQVMELSNFQSNRFWNRNDKTTAQKLYIALCLYTSAASDFAVGFDLKESGKLNWSTTASYYSLFHSARLIIFLALGDYPKGHKDIQLLFTSEASESNNRAFSCSWLKTMKKDPSISDFDSEQSEKFTFNQIITYYKNILKFTDSYLLFNSMGKILNNAKDLRNDSNYEALLIAHEYDHQKVSKYFLDLSNAMSDGSKLSLKIAAKCFEHYANNEPSFESKRDIYKFFIQEYITVRLYSSIITRTGDKSIPEVKKCTKVLENLIAQNHHFTDIENVDHQLNKLNNLVSFREFDPKQKLMEKFKKEIDKLKINIESVAVLLNE